VSMRDPNPKSVALGWAFNPRYRFTAGRKTLPQENGDDLS
jgi:hypothetical protein